MEKCVVNKKEYQKAFEALKGLLGAFAGEAAAEEHAKDWLKTVEALEFAVVQEYTYSKDEPEYTYFKDLVNVGYTALNRKIKEYLSGNRYLYDPARKIVLSYAVYYFVNEEEE